jgi:uncharacterized protein
MEYFVICITAFIGSGLTLFSGFGLGTLLLPVFGIFFPIEIAIALTAIVHFLNNIFKLFLLGKHADKPTVVRFGLPSILAAFAGAYILTILTDMEPIANYSILNIECSVSPVKFVIALLLIFFALFDLLPKLSSMQFNKKYLVAGGFISGFFGGLSGHQGALRSAFLIRLGLSKESFIATGVIIACLIDISRITVYSGEIIDSSSKISSLLMISSTLSAFLGAYIGNKMIKKITINSLQLFVGIMLVVFGLLLGMGII